MKEPRGQILPDSTFGQWLTKLMRESETALEIGTWRGEGSTRCLANGLVRATQRIWTVEQDKDRWLEAKAGYKKEQRIRFLNAHTLDIVDELPPRLDLVLFDGSDEQTNGEFDALVGKLWRYVALDDTREQKNRRQRSILLDWKWRVVAEDQQDRNGWSIFEKI